MRREQGETMKYLKILGLAAVAAAALMAFAGAGTAAADELCTEPANAEEMCPGGPITAVDMTLLGTGVITTTGHVPMATCTGGTRHMEKLHQGTGVSPIISTTQTIRWSGCNTKVETIAGGSAKMERNAGGGTTLTSIGEEVTLELFGVSCVYGTGLGTDLGEISTSGAISFSTTVSKTAGGGLCPSTALWDAEFLMTNHTTLHQIVN
jgi:hypothetical protein